MPAQTFGWVTGVLCAVVLGWLFAWFLVALWIRGDARRQGRNPLVWFFVVFLLAFIGLLLYWVVGALGRGRRRGAGGGGA